jgi:hypothetical protein
MDNPNRKYYTVAEAATHLGTSTGAVRKRLLRGTLDGIKAGGTWRVLLDIDQATPTKDAVALQELDARAAHSPGAGRNRQDKGAPPELLEDLRETITDLRARLDWTQSEISALRADGASANERADILALKYRAAQDRIRELEALTEVHGADIEAVE